MNYDDLTQEQKEVWDEAEEHGYELGFDAGLEAGHEESDYDDGYRDGVQAEQDRIQYILNMMFEAALNMGQGNKAVQYRNVMDLLKPVEINDNMIDE